MTVVYCEELDEILILTELPCGGNTLASQRIGDQLRECEYFDLLLARYEFVFLGWL